MSCFSVNVVNNEGRGDPETRNPLQAPGASAEIIGSVVNIERVRRERNLRGCPGIPLRVEGRPSGGPLVAVNLVKIYVTDVGEGQWQLSEVFPNGSYQIFGTFAPPNNFRRLPNSAFENFWNQ